MLFATWGNAQITYSGYPTSPAAAICPPSGSINTNCATFVGGTIKAYINSISGSNAVIYIVKCDGSSFGSGTFYIKNVDVCGSVVSSGSITSGITIQMNLPLSHIGNMDFRVTFTSDLSGLKYYSNNISISGTSVQYPDLININLNGPPPSVNPGQSISVSSQVQNIGSGNSGPSNVGYWISTDTILTSSDTFLGSSAAPSLSSGSSSSFLSNNVTIPSGLSPGNYYFFFKCDNNNSILESNENNNTDYFQITVLAPTPPSLQVESCFAFNPDTSQFYVGGTMNGSVAVRNTPSSQTWSGNITVFMKHNSTGTTYTLFNQYFSIPGGNAQTINFSSVLNYPTGTYNLYCSYTNAPNGGTDFIKNNGCVPSDSNTSTGTITPTKLFTILTPPANLSANNATISPNPITQGNTPTSFQNTIYNAAGAGNFSGNVYLSLHNSSGVLISDIVSQYVTINAGNNYTLVRPATPITTSTGSYKVVTKYQASDGSFVELNSTNFTVGTCVTGSGNSPVVGSAEWNATQYLCEKGIIQSQQNWTDNANQGILRQDLAKILYNGLQQNPFSSPALHYPVPFNDMQQLSGNDYWLNAVKTLAYLQYDDDKTAFDRDFVNFNPQNPIQRRYAIKALIEAFNIPLSTNTVSPYSDVTNADEMFKYIRTAYDLGIMTGNTLNCTTGTCFHPSENMTRQDAFIMLWRVLTLNISKPSGALLADGNSYFKPGNYRTATLGKVPSIDQANFNHYQKTSFSIPGRGVSLDFTHTYNSYLTELPKGFFDDINSVDTNRQKFTPLGIGWTHIYNVYAIKHEGYTNYINGIPTTEPAKIYFYYPDGSINVYNYTTLQPDGNSVGVYDVVTRANVGGVEQITVTTKGQIKYVFENRNNGNHYFIQSIRDRNDNGVKMTWNQLPTFYKLFQVQEIFTDGSLGRSLTFNYEANLSQKLKSVTDNSIGRTIEFAVDANWDLTSYKDAKGQTTNYLYESPDNYNTAHLLSEIILPKGNKIKNTYAQRKLLNSKTFASNGVASSTTYVNWTPSYTSNGYSTSSTIVDLQNRTTSYQHNALGNPTQIVSPTGTTTFNNYATGNNSNLPTSITINGQQSGISYDTKGNLLSVTKNGITNSFTYTPFNDVDTHSDGKGYVTDYNYDNKGNLIQVLRPSIGGSTNITRNTFGQVTKVTNPAGIETNFLYNSYGLNNKIILPLGIETNSTYDNASRLLSTTDANGKTTSYTYDNNDNLMQSTDANAGILQHTYDANDNHLTIKNPKNEVQTNTYNFDDDMIASETFGPHTKSYTYNNDGSLATHTRGNGTFTYTYDSATGRLASDGFTNYTYDTKGNIKTITNANGTITMNYDINDRLSNYVDYYGNTVTYNYDNNNNVTSIIYPGNKTVKYTYDALNRCTTVTDWNNKVTTYTYLIDDRISKITLPNGSYTDYTYDAAGRTTGITNKKSDATVISSYTFTLDNAGNHTQEVITEPSITAGLQNVASGTVNYGSHPYNRISTQGNTSFSHNTAGGITQAGSDTFTYDIYDNVLTIAGKISESFKYDGSGNRREKTVAGATTRYVLSILGMSQVLMETNTSNTVQNYYVYGPTGLLYRVKADNSYSYYHYDYRGSTTAMTNDAQTVTHSYSYDPFGKVLAKTEADVNPFQYVGKYGVQYESPTLTFMRARYYNPNIGRFISEDPIWHLNLYPYASNNPIMKIDPKGELEILSALVEKETILHVVKEFGVELHSLKSLVIKGNKVQATLKSGKVLTKTKSALSSLKSAIEAGISGANGIMGSFLFFYVPFTPEQLDYYNRGYIML